MTHHDDKGRYDRQERVIGKEAMKRLSETKILIVGLGGLGIETGSINSLPLLILF
jgi:molybdopterin/thiamine biosynthesis adenylyltransferase